MAVLSAMYAPLAVELFSSGVLSALLRVAQRWVAAQPRGRQDGAVTVLKKGLVNVVYAFGLTVPQARACLPAKGSSPNSLLVLAAVIEVPLSMQIADIDRMMAEEVSA